MAHDSFTPEALLGELAWLRGLSRQLVSDPEAAEDACQSTVLAALERQPDPGPGLRPWLARVVRNLSLRRRRDDGRRSRRENAVRRPDQVPATDDVVARAAAQRAVVEAVMELDEPYRTTVLLRFFDDLQPRQVAERMAVPIATVHTRLRRAMETLRERMDRKHGDRSTWAIALGAWCGVDIAPGGAASSTGPLILTWKARLIMATAAMLAITAAIYVATPSAGAPDNTADIASGSNAADPAPRTMTVPDAAVRRSAEPVAQDPGRIVEVRIVHKASGAPAAAAEVLFDSRPVPYSPDELLELRELHYDREAVLRRFGQRAVADGNGVVRLPASDMTVAARVGPEFGTVYVRTGRRPAGGWQLELERDLTLAVQTVDAQGKPVPDVPIAILQQGSSGKQYAAHRGRTGADGRLSLRHLQGHLARSDHGKLVVTTHVPGAQQSLISVDLAALPRDAVQLLAPPSGRLVVHFVDPRGAALPVGGNVELRAHDAPLPDGSVGRMDMQDERLVRANGRVVFEHVAVASKLEVIGHLCSQPFRQTVTGPKQPGEHVVVTYTLSDQTTVLCGRALDTAGAPLAGRTVTVSGDLGRQDSSLSDRFTTDSKGRFRWAVDPNTKGQVIQGVRLRCDALPEATAWAVIENLGRLDPGEGQLGDLTFAPGPLLVAGQVLLGERPAPADDLAVEVQRFRPRDRRLPAQLGGFDSWETLFSSGAEWSPEARFAVRGHLPAGTERLRVRVLCGGMQPAEVECTPGTADLRVVLQPSAAMLARISHTADVPASSLVLWIEAADGTAKGEPRPLLPGGLRPLSPNNGLFSAHQDGVTTFAWRGCKPGRYRLRVATQAESQPVCERDVTLTAGAEQVIDFDLRRELRLVRLQLVDTAGTPIADERAAVLVERDDGEPWFGVPVERGIATLLLGRAACEAVVFAPHCSALRTTLTGDAKLTLTPAMLVKVSVTDPPTLPPDVSLRIHLDVDPAGIWRSPFRLSTGSGGATLLVGRTGDCVLQPDGTFRGEVPVAGRYRIFATLANDRGKRAGLSLGSTWFEVGEGDKAKDVVVTVADDALAKALQELGH